MKCMEVALRHRIGGVRQCRPVGRFDMRVPGSALSVVGRAATCTHIFR